MHPSIPTTLDTPAVDSNQWLEQVSKKAANASETMVIMQRVDDPDPTRAAAQARDDLANGANGLALVFAGAPNAFNYGLPSSLDGLKAVLNDVSLQDVHLRIDVHPQSRASIDWLAEILQQKQVDPSRVQLSFGVDPTAIFAGTGRLRMSIEVLEASLPQSLGGFFALSLPGILLEADGRIYHNAGASEAQELGIMLASAAAHFKMFEEARQPLVYAIPHLGFALSVDQDILTSTAKIRALRLLWARMLSEYSIDPAPAVIHAETSFRMLSARDAETNIIRNTMAAFAASFGGVNSLSVLPYTLAHGLADSNARRIARNTSLILTTETRAHQLTLAQSDQADVLVASYCQDAWEEFGRIMSEGGTLRSLASGAIQQRIALSRQEKLQEISGGARQFIGTTVYPGAADPLLPTLGATSPDFPHDAAIHCDPLLAEHLDTQLMKATIPDR